MARHGSRVVTAAGGLLDAPTDGDRSRIRNARRKARARYREIDAERDAALVDAFWTELGAAVRSASPLLIFMLAIEGLSLDDAVEALAPRHGWPSRPRLRYSTKGRPAHANLSQRYTPHRPSQFAARPPFPITQRPLVSRMFDRAPDGYLELNVVDHSLEIEAKIGPTRIETRFGQLSIELDFDLPATVLVASVGRLLEEIVDHEAWRGRGWRIAATAEEDCPRVQRLIAVTGSVAYRLPWVR